MIAAVAAVDDDWRDRAACRGADPDLFFPARGDVVSVRVAKSICATCPAIDDCLTYALTLPWTDSGIYAGRSWRELRALRAQRTRGDR